MRVLVIEDTEDVGEAVAACLGRMGHAVDWQRTGEDGEELLITHDYDLVVLDVMLPGKSGLEVLRDFRQRGGSTPVLLLTARSNVDDRVSGLDIGADDYLVKPFDFRELEARLRALLRRPAETRSSILVMGNVKLDEELKRVTVDDRHVELTRREYSLLATLMARPEKVFSKQELMERLFTIDDEVNENAIELYAGRIRRKLDGATVTIRNLRGLGYRLDGPAH